MLDDKLFIIYCIADDFCKNFEPLWQKTLLASGLKQRNRSTSLSLAESLAILVTFHHSGYRSFKTFYKHILFYHKKDFPNLVSYNRFVELEKSILIPLFLFSSFLCGPCSGTSFIDSTALAVCKNKRIFHHKVFANIAQRGKNSVGWFFGFKLHIIINQYGHIINYQVTTGNVDDRTPVEKMLNNIFGKIYADKGYIGDSFFKKIWNKFKVKVLTSLKNNMKPQIVSLQDSKKLNKRSCVESVINMLKNSCYLEHSRHRSPVNFLVNVFGSLSAYNIRFVTIFQTWLGTKPPISLNI